MSSNDYTVEQIRAALAHKRLFGANSEALMRSRPITGIRARSLAESNAIRRSERTYTAQFAN